MSIHSAIRQLREGLHLSQDALAQRINALRPSERPITRQTIGHWERDDGTGTAPKRTRLEAAAQALETTVEALLGAARGTHAANGDLGDAQSPDLAHALGVVLAAVAELPPLRWVAVRGQLDRLAGHPEMLDEALPELLHQLQAPPSKLQRVSA